MIGPDLCIANQLKPHLRHLIGRQNFRFPVTLLPGLPFRKRRVKKWPWFFLRRRIALCGLKRMPVLVGYHVIDFRQIHWFRGKIPLTSCREQKAAFMSAGVLLPL